MNQDFSVLRQTMLKAKAASKALAGSSGQARNDFLGALAGLIEASLPALVLANQSDVGHARANGASPATLDRLALDEKRLRGLSQGLLACQALPDPLGKTEDLATLPDGLTVGRRRIPLGLIAFICEARPGAVIEAAAMAVKSGNALLAKPGRESLETSGLFGGLIAKALAQANLPPEAVAVRPDLGPEELKFAMSREEILDLVIPRGGEGLIRFVADNSKVPVLKHYKGVNHLYVDNLADLDMAVGLTVNGKCNRPSTCNALECLLIHQDRLFDFLPAVAKALIDNGVKVYACPRARAAVAGLEEAKDEHYGREFLDLELAMKIVDSLDEALAHIEKYGSNHTVAICTEGWAVAEAFLDRVDASCVLVNASTRLNDGGCLGLGAEIGISTSKIHAYGPMGLRELTTTKFVVVGRGHGRR
ncbi:MAG: glutamate-5-semialdehyde dehydrogenase [Deltaproteobacteria bacterium]|jgi:glutamate-5-semialdehyde dehydrogenase|nr:glutamate-5-semialdehyde dehydrogenase [Deltaproteobacteria bacterium]